MKDPELTIPQHSGEVQLWTEQAEQRLRLADAIEEQLLRQSFTDDQRAEAYERMLRYRGRAQAIWNNLKLAGC